MRRSIDATLVPLALLAAASAASAEDLGVPEQYPDLSYALEAAGPGDRILLARGAYYGPYVIDKPGVEIVGRPGARIIGYVPDSGDGPSLRGLKVDADGVVLRGITFEKTTVVVVGDGVTVEDCRFRRIGSDMGSVVLNVHGDRAVVRGNVILRPGRWVGGIAISGADAVVSGNAVDVGRSSASISVSGLRSVVEGNRVTGRGGASDLQVVSAGATVAANSVRWIRLQVIGDGNLVEGNQARGTLLGTASFEVRGGSNLVRGNTASRCEDTAFIVEGNDNRVEGNVADRVGSRIRGIGVGHGFVVRGSGNELEGDVVLGCGGEAFRVAGNDHWSYGQDPSTGLYAWARVSRGTGNRIAGCRGLGAGTCGLGNWTLDTAVTGSTFLDNGTDVVDCGGFAAFDRNRWETGGPGFEGTGTVMASGDVFMPSTIVFGD
jgi:hypothetical protein